MIGKPQWFERRKYGGWGIRPKTWQGWVYIVVLIIPFIVFQSLPFWDDKTRIIITLAWIGLILFDTLHIMSGMKLDEMEAKIDAKAERNAAWMMVTVLAVGILYQSVSSALNESLKVDPFLLIALFAGLFAKAISNLYYERKGI